MSAFAVAIGGKADMAYCIAHVCFWPKADMRGLWLRRAMSGSEHLLNLQHWRSL